MCSSPEASHFPEVGLQERPARPNPLGPVPSSHSPLPLQEPHRGLWELSPPPSPNPQGKQMCLSSIPQLLGLVHTQQATPQGGTLSLHPAGQDAAVQPLGPQPRHGRREGDKLKTTYCLETPTL